MQKNFYYKTGVQYITSTHKFYRQTNMFHILNNLRSWSSARYTKKIIFEAPSPAAHAFHIYEDSSCIAKQAKKLHEIGRL